MLLAFKFILGAFISYCLGSIPTAYILTKLFKKIDIRNVGSGNVGATNAFRVLGKLPGILVLIIDISKGLIAAAVLPDFLGLSKIIYRVIFALLAVVGHIWTVFLKFKGGKGVATTLGILLGLALKIASLRLVVFLSLLTWIIVFVLSGFVSLASILTAVLTPIYMLIFYQGIEIVSLGIILCLIIICRHISNIKRLLNKEESRVNILSRKRP